MELKYRVWDINKNHMHYLEDCDIMEINLANKYEGFSIDVGTDDSKSCGSYKFFKLDQSVGIKDKHNRKYFVNDIVRFSDNSYGVLVWFDDRLGISSGEIGNYHATDSITKEELELAEIAGNIHETDMSLF